MDTKELDELLATFAEADRAAARDLLTRNAGAQTYLDSRNTVYSAFVGGDAAALEAAGRAASTTTPPAATTTTTTTPPSAAAVPPPPGVTLDQLTSLLNERLSSINTTIETRAKEIADAQIAAARGGLIGASTELADELYGIRAAHFREFNAELDSAKFKEFFLANSAKYGNKLTDAYNAFVSEARIEKRIKDGVEAGLAAAATAAVPGSDATMPSAGSPARAFVDYNMSRPGMTPAAGAGTPAADADAAAQAFATMRRGWTQ